MEAAKFYAETFPNSKVGDVHDAPGDFPDGKEGDVLVVEFTHYGIACIGLNGGRARSSTVKPSHFRLLPKGRPKPIV